LPIAALFFLLENNIKKKPREKSQYGPRLISHWTSEAKKNNVPCHHGFTAPTSDVNDTYVEKTPRKFQFGRQSIPLLI
jgi:hypothetical protein